MASIARIALAVILLAIVVLAIREAIRKPLCVPVFVVFLLLATLMTAGKPLGLLASGGGWIILLGMLWAVPRVADALQDFLHRRGNGRT